MNIYDRDNPPALPPDNNILYSMVVQPSIIIGNSAIMTEVLNNYLQYLERITPIGQAAEPDVVVQRHYCETNVYQLGMFMACYN